MILDATLLILAAFLFGYFLGKRLGREAGLEEGRTVAPLILRQQSLELGYCILCKDAKYTKLRESE